MGFDDRGIDAQATPLGDPGRDCQVDHSLMEPLNDLGAERARNLQNRFRIGCDIAADARKGAVHQIRAHLMLELRVAPPIQVLEHQHPDHHLGGSAGPAPTPALRPAAFQRFGHHLDERFIIDQVIDAPEGVWPQLVRIGQDDFPHAALALSTSNHAHSSRGPSGARSVVRPIRSRQRKCVHSAIRRRLGSWRINQLHTDFCTGK